LGDTQRIVHLDEEGRVVVSDILHGLKPGDPVVVSVTATGRLLICPVVDPQRPWDAIEDTYGMLKDKPGTDVVLKSRDEDDRHA
jgi:hypothetical protein